MTSFLRPENLKRKLTVYNGHFVSGNLIYITLVPGLEYTFETLVECVSDLGISDQLYVFVTKDEHSMGKSIF